MVPFEENGRNPKDTRSRKEQSELGAEAAARLNTVADYRRTNQFINKHAPAAAGKHLDLVLKNRKDNQQRK